MAMADNWDGGNKDGEVVHCHEIFTHASVKNKYGWRMEKHDSHTKFIAKGALAGSMLGALCSTGLASILHEFYGFYDPKHFNKRALQFIGATTALGSVLGMYAASKKIVQDDMGWTDGEAAKKADVTVAAGR